LPAAREGDFDALVALLDPDVVVRIDGSVRRATASLVIRGATAVARQALRGLTLIITDPSVDLRPVLVNGAAGVLLTVRGRPTNVMAFTVVEGKIVEIDAIADPERVRRSASPVLTNLG
jgi:ketosteroid isomerase-like protein